MLYIVHRDNIIINFYTHTKFKWYCISAFKSNLLKFAVGYDLEEHLINNFMQGGIMENLKAGVYFENMLPTGYIGIVHNTNINKQKGLKWHKQEYFKEEILKQT